MKNLLFILVGLLLYALEIIFFKNYIASLSFPLIIVVLLILVREFLIYKRKNNKDKDILLINFLIDVLIKYQNGKFDDFSLEEEFNKRKILKNQTNFKINNIDYLSYLTTKIEDELLLNSYLTISKNMDPSILIFDLNVKKLSLSEHINKKYKELEDELIKSLIVFIILSFIFFMFLLILKNVNEEIFSEKYIVLIINIPSIMYVFYLFYLFIKGIYYEKNKK